MLHVWGTGELHTEFLWGYLTERKHLEDLCVDGRAILHQIFQNWDWGIDWIAKAHDGGEVAGACECGNEPFGPIKCGEFLDKLRTGQLLVKGSGPWD